MRILVLLAVLLFPFNSFAHSNEDFLEVVDQVRKSIVLVEISQEEPAQTGMAPGSLLDNYLKKGKPKPKSSIGTGFVIDGKYIVTNNHVIDGASTIKIYFEKSSRSYPAKLIGTDPLSDIAVLQVDKEVLKNVKAMKWGDSSKLRAGQDVWAMGHPQGLGWTVSKGVVSHTKRRISNGWQTVVQSDVSINKGNSGGPLMTEDGEIIAINTFILSKSGGSIGLSMSVDSENAQYVVAKLISDGRIDRPKMGTLLHYDPDKEEVSIEKVQPDSAADKSGIKDGDVIVTADGEKIKTVNDLFDVLQFMSPYEDLALKIKREGKEMDITLTLGILEATDIKEQQNELQPKSE